MRYTPNVPPLIINITVKTANMEQLPPDFLKTFIRYANILRFIGLDIYREGDKRYVENYIRLFIFNTILLPVIVGQIMYVTMSDKTGATFLEVANALPTALLTLQDALKMVVVYFKQDRFKIVIMSIAEIWPNLNVSEKKKKSLETWLRRLKRYDNFIYIYAILSLLIYDMAPFLLTVNEIIKGSEDMKYRFPMQSYFSCWLTSHYQYALVFIHLCITSIFLHMALYVSCDCLLIAFTYVVSTLFHQLQEDLKDAVTSYEENDEESLNKMKSFVASHQKLLWLAEELNDIFGIQIFMYLSCASVVICWFGFLTVVDHTMTFKNLLAMTYVMFAIWNLFWSGQLLTDTSFGISETAYRTLWYTKDVKIRRYILIIMQRAQKPCYLTALKFSYLTTANFTKILSTSWSYLSVINQMYEDLEI